jgi:hypothetical protein
MRRLDCVINSSFGVSRISRFSIMLCIPMRARIRQSILSADGNGRRQRRPRNWLCNLQRQRKVATSTKSIADTASPELSKLSCSMPRAKRKHKICPSYFPPPSLSQNLTQQDLLHRARKIKERLQPALARSNQDEVTLRRLTFLNHVLSKVIGHFEEAFPECSSAPPKRKPSHEPDSSDEESDTEDNTSGSPPSPTKLRRSSSMSELARGLELEEGDVHRFNQFVKKRGLHKVETLADLSSEQLLEAILSVDKETVEREVWDKAGLQKVLRRSIDEGSGKTLTEALLESKGVESVEELQKSVEEMDFSTKVEKKDLDSRSI